MVKTTLLAAAVLAASCGSHSYGLAASAEPDSHHGDRAEGLKPSHEAAKENAYRIFNAVHSAGRQWGSSLIHNGFGFIPAIMPRGTVMYHGGRNSTPTEPDWLAFEIEHAENFARSHRGGRNGPDGPPPHDDEKDHHSSPGPQSDGQHHRPPHDGEHRGPPGSQPDGKHHHPPHDGEHRGPPGPPRKGEHHPPPLPQPPFPHEGDNHSPPPPFPHGGDQRGLSRPPHTGEHPPPPHHEGDHRGLPDRHNEGGHARPPPPPHHEDDHRGPSGPHHDEEHRGLPDRHNEGGHVRPPPPPPPYHAPNEGDYRAPPPPPPYIPRGGKNHRGGPKHVSKEKNKGKQQGEEEHGEEKPEQEQQRGEQQGGEQQELRRRDQRHGKRDGRDGRHNDDDDNAIHRGYLHTYQTTRDLKLLLLDGMSAGKTDMGTLDSQDLVLRENKTGAPGFNEGPRAKELCAIAADWGYDGFVRVEAGFEVIQCDFTNGLDLISMVRTEVSEDRGRPNGFGEFAFARALGERYQGIGGDRIHIDWSSMVSGLFFPINITSTDPKRPDLERLGTASLGELLAIKSYLKGVATQPRRFTINWQAVVDLIFSRFEKRLASMARRSLSDAYFAQEIKTLTSTWFHAPPLAGDMSMAEEAKEAELNRTADAITRCRLHYLRPATVKRNQWELEDALIHTGVNVVMDNICNSIFVVRDLVSVAAEDSDLALRVAVKTGREVIVRLMDELKWTIWSYPQPCGPGEIPFIAMWPLGTKEDHWNPGCRSMDELSAPRDDSYWHSGPGGPGRGPGGPPP